MPNVVGSGAVEGFFDNREIRRRVLLDVARHRAVERAVRDGITTPDGKVRKVTRDEARALVDRVTDETIIAGAIAKGAPIGEGGRLQALFEWLWEHREAIIKFILSIIALFGDPVSIQFEKVEGGVLVTAVYPDFVVRCVV